MEPTEQVCLSPERLARHCPPRLRSLWARAATEIPASVPALTGVSVMWIDAGVPLTLAAALPTAPPASEAPDRPPLDPPPPGPDGDPLDESTWSSLARIGAAPSVRASLSLPLLEAGRVVGAVDLYAGADDAFEGRVEQIAEVIGAWAPGAVRDADLAFDTRSAARQTLVELTRRERLVEQAVDVIGRLQRLGREPARQDLRERAARAGVAEAEVARTVLVFHRS